MSPRWRVPARAEGPALAALTLAACVASVEVENALAPVRLR